MLNRTNPVNGQTKYRILPGRKMLKILLVNPWLTDFAAYNLWSEPLGLFYIGAILKECGCHVYFLDCLMSKKNPPPKLLPDGRSKFERRIIETPEPLKFVNRRYAVYGISEEEALEQLKLIPGPDVILVTSGMTYWYPGVFRAIKLLKQYYSSSIPVILGGIYAKLCYWHAAAHSGADFIYTGTRPYELLKKIEEITGRKLEKIKLYGSFNDYPIPLHQLGGKRKFIAVLTSRGCPFRCTYCASYILNSGYETRQTSGILEEIKKYALEAGKPHVAFYDDALLLNSENHIVPLFEKIAEMTGIGIHLPNGIHAGFLTQKIALLLRASRVDYIRLGLETSIPALQEKTGKKVENVEFLRAVENLRKAGYEPDEIGCYVLAGLPGQSPHDVEETLRFVEKAGVSPYIALFSPIPGTPTWKDAIKLTDLQIDKEPLFHNNTVFTLRNRAFGETAIKDLKNMALEIRRKLKSRDLDYLF